MTHDEFLQLSDDEIRELSQKDYLDYVIASGKDVVQVGFGEGEVSLRIVIDKQVQQITLKTAMARRLADELIQSADLSEAWTSTDDMADEKKTQG
jgi:hypothetical protein